MIDNTAIHNALLHITEEIAKAHKKTENPVIIGIADGGNEPARRIATMLSEKWNREIPCGFVNALFHRDDITQRTIFKEYMRTEIPVSIDNATVILVDDVLSSGRTVRAALNELFDNGRPECVELAVLCDLDRKNLPIQANYIGFKMETNSNEKVKIKLSETDPKHDTLTVEKI
jgi:pyrimidine operon attenuation protein/uracil phosphoribosyltransferase